MPTHCLAHRLELSFSTACKEVKLYEKMSTLAQGLYYYYKKSTLNRANLRNSDIMEYVESDVHVRSTRAQAAVVETDADNLVKTILPSKVVMPSRVGGNTMGPAHVASTQ